ncbi:UNVERIFIED_CONTAM: hypothetical protein Sindi_2907800 [Sesamum indicum]
MEVLHLGLLQLIEQDLQFSYHWKCEPAKVFQLGFADDLLLFCRADLNSLRTLKRGLDRFAEWSGLRLNVQKSHVIISRSAQDCLYPIVNHFLLKIDARINGWEGISLSYAGRIQIIKSVLSAMSIYWASAFILPKAIIKQIEKRLRTFLWKGTSTSGYAKTRLHNTSIWTINEKGGSWGWRKLLRLRNSILPMTEFLIGEGRSFYLWKNPWHHLGPLIARFRRGPSLLGIDESAKLQIVINEGQWQWPLHYRFGMYGDYLHVTPDSWRG